MGRESGRVGLLGGSFNPAHRGHVHVSREALRRLGLDEVWWLVSPQNPLKPRAGMAPLAERLTTAKRLARDPRIRVTALEAALGTRFTVDTVRALRRRFPRIRFVWLIGADNLVQIPRWRAWSELFAIVPVAVFARPTYSLEAMAGKAVKRFALARIAETEAHSLPERVPPAWAFIPIPLDATSATAIRAARETGATGLRGGQQR